MIFNLTHREDMTPIQRLAVAYKVSIGEPAKDGKNYPSKSDYFHIRAKNGSGDWIDDVAFGEALRQKYMPEIETEQGKRRMPLREFDIVLLSDDIEEVFRTELAWWSSSEKKCFGNGKEAQRSITALPKDQQAQYSERWIPWEPCGDTCPEMESGKCKPSGALYFIFKDRPIMGSVAAYYTTSYETVRRIHSSLLQIQTLTGGRLKGIPLKIVVRPGRTRYEQDGKAKTGTAFFVNIEFRQEDYAQLIPALLQHSVSYDRALLAQRSLTTNLDDDDVVTVEPEPEDQRAPQMANEFYPDNREAAKPTGPRVEVVGATTATQDESVVGNYCNALGLNVAQRETMYKRFGGDLGAIREWVGALAAHVKAHRLTTPKAQELFTAAIMADPSELSTLLARDLAASSKAATPDAGRKRQRKGKGGTATETAPAAAASAAPPDDDPPPPEEAAANGDGQKTWGFF